METRTIRALIRSSKWRVTSNMTSKMQETRGLWDGQFMCFAPRGGNVPAMKAARKTRQLQKRTCQKLNAIGVIKRDIMLETVQITEEPPLKAKTVRIHQKS